MRMVEKFWLWLEKYCPIDSWVYRVAKHKATRAAIKRVGKLSISLTEEKYQKALAQERANRKKYESAEHFDHTKKIIANWPKWKQKAGVSVGKPYPTDHLTEKFVLSTVDNKPGETVEVRPEGVIIRPVKTRFDLQQKAKALRRFKRIWRQTDRTMPWKEFRAEINSMHSFSNSFFEATQMVRDREIARANCFYRVYRSTGHKDLAAGVSKSIDRC